MALEYECQVCGGTVLQLIDERGLPERPSACPWCEEQTAEAVERFRERERHRRRAPACQQSGG